MIDRAADPLLDIPAFLAAGSPERAAAVARGRELIAARPTKATAPTAPRKSLTGPTPLSSAAGQRAQQVADLIKLEPRTRDEVAEMLGWHPAALASAINLAKTHNLIAQQGTRFVYVGGAAR